MLVYGLKEKIALPVARADARRRKGPHSKSETGIRSFVQEGGEGGVDAGKSATMQVKAGTIRRRE